MAAVDVIPVPTCEKLKELQLMRYTLVKFVDLRNFEEAIQGCYVRVLLEMRADREPTTASSGDSYYIAAVKGAQEGLSYSGFSWDGITTKWHIIIDLPPCFRSGPNNNIVQLNSISNSPFSDAEYRDWVRMGSEAKRTFPTLAQLDLRVGLLNEALARANIDTAQQGGTKRRRQPAVEEDPEKVLERERLWRTLKEQAAEEIRRKYIILPSLKRLENAKMDELTRCHREGLDLAGRLRTAITERNRCRVCRDRPVAIVCYPCKHLAMCVECSKTMDTCPICKERVQQFIEPFST